MNVELFIEVDNVCVLDLPFLLPPLLFMQCTLLIRTFSLGCYLGDLLEEW